MFEKQSKASLQIHNLNSEILTNIQECEHKMNLIKQMEVDNKTDQVVKNNVVYSLAMKIQKITMETRQIEHKYLQEFKESQQDTHLQNSGHQLQGQVDEEDEDFDYQVYKNKEINEIVEQTKALA